MLRLGLDLFYTGINRLRQVAMLNLHKATFSVEESWSSVLNLDISKPKSEGGASLSDVKDQIQANNLRVFLRNLFVVYFNQIHMV